MVGRALIKVLVVPLGALMAGALGCSRPVAVPLREPGTRAEAAPPVVQPIYQGGLVGGWRELSPAPREPSDGGPLRLTWTEPRSWIVDDVQLKGAFGGLVLRFRASATYGDFLEVRLDSDSAELFPRVRVEPRHRRELEGGWSEVFVPMAELNPKGVGFVRVMLRSRAPLPAPGVVELDGLGLTGGGGSVRVRQDWATASAAQPVALLLDCRAEVTPIDPLIYGIGLRLPEELQSTAVWRLKPSIRRWGTVLSSRYNWELGNASNSGAAGFFKNVELAKVPDFSWSAMLQASVDRGVPLALTVPTLGWVARDTKSSSFPESDYGKQEQVDDQGAGNGLGRDGQPLKASPSRTSVPASPEYVARWVAAIRRFEDKQGKAVGLYLLDHEPDRWHLTHRDVHPAPVTYDELLDRTIRYGGAVRKADGAARIAGPGWSGWAGYETSAADAEAKAGTRADRLAHGDVSLFEWYLSKLAEHRLKTGTKILDLLDLHYTPRGRGLGQGADGDTDTETAERRLQAVRGLWDPGYVEEGAQEPLALIPRMREWVARRNPGLGLCLGDWGFGAEGHMSGGLAVAEALGRFGQEGLGAAFYRAPPIEDSPAAFAFRAFRDFDGSGAAFEGFALPRVEEPKHTSLFAARSADGRRMTLVLLNKSPEEVVDANVRLNRCAGVERQRVFTYLGDPRGFEERAVLPGRAYRLPPYSMTVVELLLEHPGGGAPAE